jgi:symplekin
MSQSSSFQGFDDDDDDYEPDFQPAEDDEQILNKLDNAPPEGDRDREPEVTLGPFRLPRPSPFTDEELDDVSQGTVVRIFEFMNTLDDPSPAKRQKTGINRLAASNYDRDSWITLIARLATRASAGLETIEDNVKSEDSDGTRRGRIAIGNRIRDSLYVYILEDFRKRIDIAVGWLTEEWYNERMQMRAGNDVVPRYEKWAIKVLDGILPYLDAKDNRVFTRYLSEIPDLSKELLERVKTLCLDPERVQLVITSLQ